MIKRMEPNLLLPKSEVLVGEVKMRELIGRGRLTGIGPQTRFTEEAEKK